MFSSLFRLFSGGSTGGSDAPASDAARDRLESAFLEWLNFDFEGVDTELRREVNGGLSVRVVRPNVPTHAWLVRVHDDANPETRPLSRDVHVTAEHGATRVWFYPHRDIVHASKSGERKIARSASLVLEPSITKLPNVPKELKNQAMALASDAWRAFPVADQSHPVVRYMPKSAQLEVAVVCAPNVRVSLEELDSFVGSVGAKRAWFACDMEDHPPLLTVCARVDADPVALERMERTASANRDATGGDGGGGGGKRMKLDSSAAA